MSELKGKTVLVTGAAGFIGSHPCDALLEQEECRVIGIDNLSLGDLRNLKKANRYKSFREVIGNAADEELMRELCASEKIDIVFNLATRPINDSFIDPRDCAENSVQIMLTLLELQRKQFLSTIVNFSTSEVYGDLGHQEYFDTRSPMKPLTAYAAGKAASDLIFGSYVASLECRGYTIRPYNNFGPRQAYKPDLAGLIPNTIMRILAGKSPIIRGDGEQIREYVYVHECIDEIIKSFSSWKNGDIVTIGSGCQYSVKEIVNAICDIMRFRGEVLYETSRPADAVMHKSNIKLDAPVKAERKERFYAGLVKTVEYYKNISMCKNT